MNHLRDVSGSDAVAEDLLHDFAREGINRYQRKLDLLDAKRYAILRGSEQVLGLGETNGYMFEGVQAPCYLWVSYK